jgi:hypothetical protein
MMITLMRSLTELELRCMISGAGMVVTANEFPIPILIDPHECLVVRVQDGYVAAERGSEGNPTTDYWHANYVNKGMCSLCGNTGVIDTRGVCTPAGLEVGRMNYCICPNGQSMREHGRVEGAFVRIKGRHYPC